MKECTHIFQEFTVVWDSEGNKALILKCKKCGLIGKVTFLEPEGGKVSHEE
jgi:hypothetical protein